MTQGVDEKTEGPKAAQELSRLVTESASVPALERNRTYSLGTAAVALAMLLQLLQLSDIDLALRITVVACAIALPMSVLMIFAIEYYLLLGPRSYPHYVLFARARAITWVVAMQGIGRCGCHRRRSVPCPAPRDVDFYRILNRCSVSHDGLALQPGRMVVQSAVR